MKTLTKSRFLSRMMLVASVCFAFPAFAGTWYVDAARPDDAGDGLSPATAKKYIQSAVALAQNSSDGDRIVKVAPGTYDEGENLDVHGCRNRVVITKKLTLESTEGRDKTFIVGVRDATASGMGPNSVRGIFLSGEAVEGTVIRGFTFKTCSAPNGSETGKNSGGAVGFGRDDTTVYVKDCAAIDCVASYGGAFSRVTAIRCLALRCSNGNGGNAGSALYECKAYCCVFDSCGSTTSYAEQILRGDGPYVNCTAVGNSGSLLRTSASQRMYNFLSCLANRQECDTTNSGGDYVITCYSQGSFEHRKTVTDAAAIRSLLLSPLTGDYRLVAGGGAENYADPKYCLLDWIPEEDRGLDFYGTVFAVSGAAGSIHCGAVQTAVPVAGGSFALARTMPTKEGGSVIANIHAQTNVWPGQVWIPTDDSVFAVGFGTAAPTRFPTAAGGFWQTIPEDVSIVGSPIRTTAKLTVGAGQTYTSIQAAIDAASDAVDAYTIIAVEPGTYGPISVSGKNVFIRSTQGKAVTTIQGVKDTDDPATAGCGPKAVRCVTVDSSAGRWVAVEGFTLRGGGTAIGGEGSASEVWGPTTGGGFAAKTAASDKSGAQLIGCDIVDCSGFDGAAVWDGWLQGCTIRDCKQPVISGADSVVRQAFLSSCVLCENDFYGNQVLAGGTQANNCTIVARANGVAKDISSKTSFLQGVIVCGGTNSKATPTVGSVFFGLQGAIAVTSGYTTDDPRLVNAEAGHFSLLEGSSAVGLWNMAEGKVTTNDPWEYMVGDYEGNPMMVVDGRVTAGAFQTFYQPKDVYVDAARADDEGNGLTAETAKRTLAGAMAVAEYGDTIHVAAGTYDAGTMPQRVAVGSGTGFTVAARVIVPAQATLIGAGAGQTIIRGGYVEGEAGELVRCVILGAGATLKGVTVERGLVRFDGQASDDKNAAGVLGDRTSVVEDCIIENNHSYRYGGVYGGTFRRCVIRNNWASSGEASAGSFLTAENCLFTANRGRSIVCDYERIVNCTFLYDNMSTGTSRIALFGDSAEGAGIYNSALILAPTQTEAPLPALYNCLVPRIVGTTWKWKIASSTDCLLEETTVDASWDGVPAKDFVGLDRGCTVVAPDGADLAGVQRVQNAAVDIGCYEFDWLPTYTTDFDKHGWAVVTATTGTVTDADGKLVLAEEAGVTARVTQATQRVLLAAATVTGELVVRVNGTVVGTVVADAPKLSLGELAAGDLIEVIASSGTATGLALKSDCGLVVIFR